MFYETIQKNNTGFTLADQPRSNRAWPCSSREDKEWFVTFLLTKNSCRPTVW